MDKSLQRNIPILYTFGGLWGLTFVFAVYAIIMFERGLTLADLLIINGILLIIPVILTIPSGYIADVYGRKTSLIIAALAYVAGFVIFFFAGDVSTFGLAMALVGVGLAFESGADSALTYDTLLSLKRKKDYKSVYGMYRLIGFASLGVASFAAGIMAEIWLLLPVAATIIAYALALGVVAFVKEPPRKKLIIKNHVKELMRIIVFTVKHPVLRLTLLYGVFVAPVNITVFLFVQPLTQAAGLSYTAIGIYYGLGMAAYGSGSYLGHRLFSTRYIFIISSLFGGSFLIIAGMNPTPLTLLLLPAAAFLYGAGLVAISDLINHHTTSDKRATVLSTYSLAIATTGAIFAFAVVPVASVGIANIVQWSGVGTVIGGSFVGLLLFRKGHPN